MWSWKRGFAEKSEGGKAGTWLAPGGWLLSLPHSLNLMHSDLFSFILLISALLPLSQIWVCARAVPSWQDSGGNNTDSRPDYGSLLWLCRIPPASLQRRPQNSEPLQQSARSLLPPVHLSSHLLGLTRSTIQYRNGKIIMPFIIPKAWAQIRLQSLVY